jgi:hypothetical protein
MTARGRSNTRHRQGLGASGTIRRLLVLHAAFLRLAV